MSVTRYGFSQVISGFFEFPVENARRIVPRGIEPVELHHGSAVLNVTAFDFNESEVGTYREVFMAVVVVPMVKPGEPLPHTAFYPYVVATNTKASREHAIERWHLPHWMEEVDILFETTPSGQRARLICEGAPALDVTVTDHSWEPKTLHFQSFMRDESGSYLAKVAMEGQRCEHEEETGLLTLHDHPFNEALSVVDVSEQPFREMWMKSGMQTFQPLITL